MPDMLEATVKVIDYHHEVVDALTLQINNDYDPNEWVLKHHSKNGLRKACEKAPCTYKDAESSFVAMLAKYSNFHLVGGNLKDFDLEVTKQRMPTLYKQLKEKKLSIGECVEYHGFNFDNIKEKAHRSEQDVDIMRISVKTSDLVERGRWRRGTQGTTSFK